MSKKLDNDSHGGPSSADDYLSKIEKAYDHVALHKTNELADDLQHLTCREDEGSNNFNGSTDVIETRNCSLKGTERDGKEPMNQTEEASTPDSSGYNSEFDLRKLGFQESMKPIPLNSFLKHQYPTLAANLEPKHCTGNAILESDKFYIVKLDESQLKAHSYGITRPKNQETFGISSTREENLSVPPTHPGTSTQNVHENRDASESETQQTAKLRFPNEISVDAMLQDQARRIKLLKTRISQHSGDTPTAQPQMATATISAISQASNGAAGEQATAATNLRTNDYRAPSPAPPNFRANPPPYEECVKDQPTRVDMSSFTPCGPPPPVYKPTTCPRESEQQQRRTDTAAVVIPESPSRRFGTSYSLDHLIRMEERDPPARRRPRRQLGGHDTMSGEVTALLAFVGCLLCWPVGLLALYYSYVARVYKHAGNYAQARAFSKSALVCAVAAVMMGALSLGVMYFYRHSSSYQAHNAIAYARH